MRLQQEDEALGRSGSRLRVLQRNGAGFSDKPPCTTASRRPENPTMEHVVNVEEPIPVGRRATVAGDLNVQKLAPRRGDIRDPWLAWAPLGVSLHA